MFSPKKFKHKGYKYIPRFYDPVQEELDHKIQNAEMAKAGDVTAIKQRIAHGLHNSAYRGRRSSSGQILKSNMMLIAVLAVLLVLAAAFVRFYLPKILQMLGS